ncbi:MAG: 1-deoxy-D-xylulose-5-phosphate reductoisomerase [Rhodocyclaceae bacterium]|nr:1-deoxy-D-xylulose-5-phosphate reductoisomerase [Rhodocyclaceae bacterium]
MRARLSILGATGSIGRSTLDVVARHPDRFEVFAVSGHSRVDALFDICRAHRPAIAVVPDERTASSLRQRLHGLALPTLVESGEAALAAIAAAPEADIVMAAIVGAAGLVPTLAAARAGKKLLLANKEALVMAGDLLIEAVRRSGGQLLPVDSEHNAIFQCLPKHGGGEPDLRGVRRILLTASGGPFRQTPNSALASVTPDAACAHPNWVMGRKISVDSATMMNKGLEIIEAHYLFGMDAARIEVLVHPQSIVHSLVAFDDGSVIAQLGQPDMRTPIAYALAYPDRIDAGVDTLDLARIGRLDFESPDFLRFPCLELAYRALRASGTACAILNAANEEAVAAFLDGRLSFPGIAEVVAATLDAVADTRATALDDILEVDRKARAWAKERLAARTVRPA